ncbi:restriction endonuclease subunit S, partial [Hydrogenimonas sp.]
MGKYPIQVMSSFLTERKERLTPDEANALNIKRIEKIDFSGQIHLADNKPTKTGMIIIKKGDLVISGINVAKGALAVYDGDEDVIATIHYSAYSFDTGKLDIEFLKWFVKSPAFVKALQEQTSGGIKTEIKAKKFLALKIPMPPLNDQQLIASRLNEFEQKYKKIQSELQTQSDL